MQYRPYHVSLPAPKLVAELSGVYSHWHVACKHWVRPAVEPVFEPLGFGHPAKPASRPGKEPSCGYWDDLVRRVLAGDPSGEADFNGLYRPAIKLMLADHFGADRGRALLEPTLKRILDRIAAGELTAVKEIAVVIGKADTQSTAVLEASPSTAPPNPGVHRRAS